MAKISCSGMLFDLDGVLVSSLHVVERVWSRWAIDHGLDPKVVVAKAHGRPSLATVRDFMPGADHDAENRIIERMEVEDLDGVIALPGAQELLSSLPPERWAIVTSGTRPLAEARIGAAGLPVPRRLITANDIQRGKPDPEPYLKGAARLGVPPAQCVVVEDAPPGVLSGKAAGAKVIALRNTVEDEQLRLAGADWIAENCASISAVSRGGAGLEVIVKGLA